MPIKPHTYYVYCFHEGEVKDGQIVQRQSHDTQNNLTYGTAKKIYKEQKKLAETEGRWTYIALGKNYAANMAEDILKWKRDYVVVHTPPLKRLKKGDKVRVDIHGKCTDTDVMMALKQRGINRSVRIDSHSETNRRIEYRKVTSLSKEAKQ